MTKLCGLLIGVASLSLVACGGAAVTNTSANASAASGNASREADRSDEAERRDDQAEARNEAKAAPDAAERRDAPAGGDGDDAQIVIVNHSGQRIISFNILSGGNWGSNYAERQIPVDGTREIHLDADSADGCTIRTRIVFSGNQRDFEGDVNYCNATYLNVGAQDVWPEE